MLWLEGCVCVCIQIDIHTAAFGLFRGALEQESSKVFRMRRYWLVIEAVTY